MTSKSRLLRSFLGVAVLAVAVGFFAAQFKLEGHEALARFHDANPMLLIASAILIFASYALDVSASTYAYRIAAPDAPMPYRTAFTLFSLSNIVRYLPGSYWSYLYQLDQTLRHGYRGLALVYANILNLIWGTSAAAALSGLALICLPGQETLGYLVLAGALCALGVAVFLPRPLMKILARFTKVGTQMPLPTPVAQARGFLIWIASWVAAGGAAIAIACALQEAPSGSEIGLLLGSMAFGGIASTAAAFVPAGLGVREGAMFWILKPVFGPELALLVPLGTRALFLLCEISMAGSALTVYRARPLVAK